jgi:hypothetical protein
MEMMESQEAVALEVGLALLPLELSLSPLAIKRGHIPSLRKVYGAHRLRQALCRVLDV